MRQLAKIVAVQIVILLFGLVAIEYALAWFMPLPPHGGEYMDRSGKPARVALDENTLAPNLDLVHAASEFSARIHTNALGYRRMSKESRTPDFLFVGDSFTFGHGVSDDEVFAEIFCNKHSLTCLNLGRSGTDTFDQVRVLRHGIDTHQLRPKTVIVTMLAACWLRSAGNDLGDNLAHRGADGRSDLLRQPLARASFAPPAGDIVKAIQQRVAGLEITKRVMLIATSSVKASVYACSEQAQLEAARRATAAALQQLATLAGEFGFEVAVVVIHPYQELDGAYRTTEAVVAGAMPENFRCLGTGARFRQAEYYPYDGHFNAKGHAVLAAILDEAVTGGRLGPGANARCRSSGQ